jgi:hypothetical protein
MNKWMCMVLMLAAVVLIGVYLSTLASCKPQPICEYEDCRIGGHVCFGWKVHPCPDGSFAQACYQEYWCPSRGYLLDWEGDTCCVPCN